MNIDKLLTFTAESAALSADGQIGKVIDMGNGRKFGVAPNTIYLNILVKAAAATSSGTGRFKLVTGTAVSSATPPVITTGKATVMESRLFGLTDLTVKAFISIPIDYSTFKRYVALDWDEVATLSALKVGAWLSLAPYEHTTYADAIN